MKTLITITLLLLAYSNCFAIQELPVKNCSEEFYIENISEQVRVLGKKFLKSEQNLEQYFAEYESQSDKYKYGVPERKAFEWSTTYENRLLSYEAQWRPKLDSIYRKWKNESLNLIEFLKELQTKGYGYSYNKNIVDKSYIYIPIKLSASYDSLNQNLCLNVNFKHNVNQKLGIKYFLLTDEIKLLVE